MVRTIDTEKDLPQSIIVVLVLLAVIISVFGSWIVLQEISRVQTTRVTTPDTQTGKVMLKVVDQNDHGPTASAQGKALITILEANTNG